MYRVVCLILLCLCAAAPHTPGQKRPRRAKAATATFRIRWNGQPGVSRYRLQLARDAQFTDIVFDRAVMGREYEMTELPPGNYFWRVAPAAEETGEFSTPEPVRINEAPASAAPPGTATPSLTRVILTPPSGLGWRTATGHITQPLAAHLRSATSFDMVGVNSDGMVYALDATSGIALWAARYRPGARRGETTGNGGARPFTPVLISSRQNGMVNVVAAFDGGLRALDGASGREMWRASLPDRAASGVALDVKENSPPLISIITDAAPGLCTLNAETGQVVSRKALEAKAIGAPVRFATNNGRGILLALEGGMIEMRGVNGDRIRAVKLDTTITTPPLFVNTPHGPVALVGTESGLLALDGTDLHPLGRVATEKDAPRGILSAADLDGDGTPEIILVTRRGRVVVIGTADGKIKWYSQDAMASDAAGAAFADLNGDGVLDVLVAAGPAFAVGFSGRDGSVIWKADEQEGKGGAAAAGVESTARALATAETSNGAAPLLVGSDTGRTGLRAVVLPSGAVKASMR